MRTINSAYDELLAKDADTCITKNAIRQLVITGKIPSVTIGKKYLVNMSVLEAFLQGSNEVQQVQNSGIRRLPEKIR
jgi:hypothetical protein